MPVDFTVFNKPVSKQKRKLVDEPVNQDLIKKNKFANNSQYIPESVYKRILNQMTDYQWSFVPYAIEEKQDYTQFIGQLVVPGFGVHTGIGAAKANKKDNSNSLSVAKTYAFKNACKEMGLAPNVDDDDELYEEEIFENLDLEELEDDDEEAFDLTDEDEEEEEEKPKKKEKKSSRPKKTEAKTTKDRIKEVREAYELENDDDFVAFIQIWNEEILEVDDMDDEDWDEFLEYLEENKEEFEDF